MDARITFSDNAVLSVVALVMSVVGKAGQHVETLLSSISWWFLAAGAMCVAAGACAQVVEVVISTTGLNEESYAALSGRKAPNVKTAISRYTYARQCMAVGRFDDAEVC